MTNSKTILSEATFIGQWQRESHGWHKQPITRVRITDFGPEVGIKAVVDYSHNSKADFLGGESRSHWYGYSWESSPERIAYWQQRIDEQCTEGVR